MRYCDSILGEVLKPISRRRFAAIVDRHDGDAYDKSFTSWDHLVTLIFAQLGGVDRLRTLETLWNANEQHHYHLDVGRLKRSTLSDANARRPIAVFSETFEMLSGLADRVLRREGGEMLRLIDATPIPTHELVTWAKWNGRTRGLKLHVVYDPAADQPRRIAITPATVNDVEVGQQVPIETGATYIYDKAYCHYGWWTQLHEAGARFVTRQKKNARYRATCWRRLRKSTADGFTVIDDAEVKLVSKSGVKLAIPMRRVRIKRDDRTKITLITNDLVRSAIEIASLYKRRWQIELLFRWIKQHLKIRKFLGRSQNAICLQLIAAMIAYLLLRVAAQNNAIKLQPIRFVELLATRLFLRTRIARIDKPPMVKPSKAQQRFPPNQLEFCYA
jgi:putative transposase